MMMAQSNSFGVCWNPRVHYFLFCLDINVEMRIFGN